MKAKKGKRSTSASSRPADLKLAPVSCPDCGGVLSVRQGGRGARPLYVCQINHRHSITSLYQAMELRLENTLWTVDVTMKQLDTVYQELLSHTQQPAESPPKNIKRRLRELQKQRAAIGEIITGTHVAESIT
jgi:hypothetical protein